MPKYITEDIEIFYDKSDKGNSDKKILMKKILMKKIIVKKRGDQIYYLGH